MPSSFFVSLLFEGIIWFLLPTALVIVNDIMAYLAGALCVVWVGGCVQHTVWMLLQTE
jgi:hypothetical protein